MTSRALIIAIEDYALANGDLKNKLPHTLDAGIAFREWITAKWKVEGLGARDTQLLFCSEPRQADGSGATRKDIIESLIALRDQGSGQTDELFVFFSGHGFAFVDGGDRADVIITSDFVDRQRSGDACLSLDWIVQWLRDTLGKDGRHYYFIDACRNELNGNAISVSTQLLPNPKSVGGGVSNYILQSTMPSRFAAASAHFPTALVDGLQGKGKAKVWDTESTDSMRVRYDSLRLYVMDKLQTLQPVTTSNDGPKGEADAVLATITPVPKMNLRIEIEGAAKVPGEAHIYRGRSKVAEIHAFDGWPQDLTLEPDTYRVEVVLPNSTVTGANPLRIDLYEDFVHRLRRPDTSNAAAPAPKLTDATAAHGYTEVEVVVPPRSTYKLRNVDTGEVNVMEATQSIRLAQGRYSTTLRTTNKALVRRCDLELTGDAPSTIDVAAVWKGSVPMSSIAGALPELDGWPDFSASLGGPVVDPDLDVWLALIGGGRILNGIPGEDFQKIDRLPLHTFCDVQIGSSPLYVLAGVENPGQTIEVWVGHEGWRPLARTELAGVLEGYDSEGPKDGLFSCRIDGKNVYTVACGGMADRVTMITLTLDASRNWRVTQYMLPVGSNAAERPLHEPHKRPWSGSALAKVLFLAQAHRAFRRRLTFKKEFAAVDWDPIKDCCWLDPIGWALAGYELIRRGDSLLIPALVFHMRNQFDQQVPDDPALLRLCGERHYLDQTERNGVPLFQDGLRAFSDNLDWLPLPANHIDFNSPWTAWRVAVE